MKLRYFIKADHFLLENKVVDKGYLLIENGIFSSIVDEVSSEDNVVDWSGFSVAPGLFDTHIHGIDGYDIMDGTEEAVKKISISLAARGVTRFLPTTLTSSSEDLNKAIMAVKSMVQQGLPGAQSEGIFLEGPYFTETHKGAQNEKYFKDPSLEEFNEWQKLADGMIRKIALAPERTGTQEFIRSVKRSGVQVSIAHTDADYVCCEEAIENGANNFVHLYNGMKGMHHREPGTVGSALRSKNSFVEIVCDGLHVHPEVATLTYQLKQDRLMLITDCMRAGGMPDGEYTLGEFPVAITDGVARTETGSLAGSTLELIDGVKNLCEWTKEDLTDIWHLASLTPAKSLGLESKFGSIAEGKKADYVVLNSNLEVECTAVNGKVIYSRE